MKSIFRFLVLLLLPMQAWAANIDLQVSSYTYNPDPVINGGLAAFTLSVQNNGSAASDISELTVALPTNVTYANNSSGCSYSAPNLTCPIAALANGATATVNYTATGNGAAAVPTTATIAEAATDTDTNAVNNALTKTITSIKGADLTISHAGPSGCTSGCTATAGSTISYTLLVTNNGNDPATTFDVTYDLPAAIDFNFASASGSGWNCPAPSGTTLTCSYSGANIASSNSAPAITVTGQIITSAGSITTGASVASTDNATGDPNLTNNGPVLRVISVTAGTNLRANKAMVSTATGLTNFVNAEAVTLTLSATNTGTQQATGVKVTDSVPADFTIGALPGGCTASAQNITCTVGTLNAGATSANFVIPLTVIGTAGNSGSNTANVTRTGPAGGNNTPATTNYSVVAPYAHLTLSKSKTPDPIANGGTITSTIAVRNSASSTSPVTGTVTVEDRLSANETFASNTANGWTCSASGSPQVVVCDYSIAGSIARNATLPNLVILSTASASTVLDISNNACTGSSISSSQSPLDNVAETCTGLKTVVGTPNNVDLSVTKTANPADPAHVLVGNNSFTYTLIVSNAGGSDTAPTVNVTDTINAWYVGDAGTTGGNITVTPVLGVGESCTLGATTSCVLKNLAGGNSRTIVITLNRPFKDGSIANTAAVSTPDAVDTNSANNTASDDVIIDPISDVTVTGIADAPDPVRVGVALTYTTSVKNKGPSTAAGVVLRHTIDPARMGYVDATASLTGGGTCVYTSAFSGTPYAGLAGIECSGFSLNNGESRQLTFDTIPVFPYPDNLDATYSSNATITTTTTDSNSGNNTASNTANVTSDKIDIAVTNQESLGYDPDGAGPLSNQRYDPVGFGDNIKYLVTIQNNGPSLATNVEVSDILTPPAGWTGEYIGVAVDGTSSYTPLAAVSCSVTAGATPGTNASPQVLTCHLGSGLSDSILPTGKKVVLELTFNTGGTDPVNSITFINAATVKSAETGASPYAGDTLTGNNEVSENTTVLPKTDLYITKDADVGADGDSSPYNINEIFNYTLTIGNKGPSNSTGATVTDTLPSGFVAAGNVSVATGSNVTLSTNTCSGSAWSGSCDIAPLPVDATGANAADQVVITIPVRAVYPYTGAINSNIVNNASIAPIVLSGSIPTSIDTDASNNSDSVNVQIRDHSIAGTVYADNDLDNVIDAGEGINAVTVTLSGTDAYSNALTGIVATANTNGLFSFAKLPPGNYQIVETQPANYWDRYETVGTAGGNKPAETCDGTVNCGATAPQNTISSISLPIASSTNATGYIFQEVQQAQLSGYVYFDANNDGDRDGAETGIASLIDHISLSGNAYNGIDVTTLITETVSLNALGQFNYSGLPPSDGAGYTITQNSQPVGFFDGKNQKGDGIGNVVANSAGNQLFGVAANTDTETIASVVLTPNQNKTEHNFGELRPASLSGSVYIDSNSDAIKDAAETVGLPNVTVTLTGIDHIGNALTIPTTVTNSSGAYSFTELVPGTYAVTVTPPAGLTHTGSEAGSNGGSDAGVGIGNVTITSITITSNETVTGYNFGETGEGLSGYVYVDTNANGIKDSAESGISGVDITVSGNALAGGSVCNYIVSCTVTTDSAGQYIFPDLPGADASGYTLTEQSQASFPLSAYADGLDTKGTGIAIAGTAANDVISEIGIVLGEFGINYNFAETPASLAGTVYFDSNDNASLDSGETGIDDVVVTLTGYSWGGNGSDDSGAGDDIAITAVPFTTANGGHYSFGDLLLGTYAITETHPDDWGDGQETAGTSAGVTANAGFDNSPANNSITDIQLGAGINATGYLFGERSSGLSGRVCEDANDDGICQSEETGIADVTITLSGTTASGSTDICAFISPASCTAVTGADGSYSFPDLPAGSYSLTETHPVVYLDGKEGVGSAGGTADNTDFDSSAGHNSISTITLPGGSNGINYDFGEQILTDATIEGHVWLDLNHDRVRDANETIFAGWTVSLWHEETQVESAITDEAGFYSMSVPPNTGYELRFTHPNTSVLFGGAVPNERGNPFSANVASTDNPAGGDNSTGSLKNLTIISGSNIPEQSLPLDPAGVVYDSVTRDPLAGAVISISGPGGFTPASHLLGGSANVSQTTGNDGFYQFLLLPGAPAGDYTLKVTAYPEGYAPQPSALIPVCSNTLSVGAVPDPALVQVSNEAPLTGATLHNANACPSTSAGLAATAASTQYYFVFNLDAAVSGDVVNNHIPIDPVLGGAIAVTKTTTKTNVVKGELVPYTITATNTLTAVLTSIDLQDQVPAGFKYVDGSARLDDASVNPTVDGRNLSWSNLTFAGNSSKTIQLILIVGSGVSEGKYVNQAWAMNSLVDARVSNIGSATVRVVPDPLFDCSDLIGKVFDDKNVNGYQDEGEPGLAGVRVVTVRGLLITTDDYGRFHIACADVPNELHGSNFIMKLDTRTLPSGYRITTENPRVVRLTRGKLVKLNFGAALHRMIRVDIDQTAFNAKGDQLSPVANEQLSDLVEMLKQQPSQMRLSYAIQAGETESDAKDRMQLFADALTELWQQCDCDNYALIIEQEILTREKRITSEPAKGRVK